MTIIIINGFEKEIHQGECFLVKPNDIVVIHAESDMTFSKVKDQNMVSLNRSNAKQPGENTEGR